MRGLGKWPGLGERITQGLKNKGYWKNGKPEVIRFCIERGFVPNYLYKWLAGTMPGYDNLIKLCTVLGMTPAELVFGPDEGQGAVNAFVFEVAGGPIPRPKITIAGAAALPGQEDSHSRDYVKYPRKPLAPVRRLPRRIASTA